MACELCYPLAIGQEEEQRCAWAWKAGGKGKEGERKGKEWGWAGFRAAIVFRDKGGHFWHGCGFVFGDRSRGGR
jgi:hypothetical protein